MARYHISPKIGPAICSAKKQCEYEQNGEKIKHYPNKAAAYQAYEEILSKEYSNTTTQTKTPPLSQTLSEDQKTINKYINNKNGITIPEIEKLEKIGKNINDEIFKQTKIDKNKNEYTNDEYRKIAEKTTEILKQLQGEKVPVNPNIFGPQSQALKNTINALPTGIASLVKDEIETKTLPKNTIVNAGYCGYGITKEIKEKPRTVSDMKIPKNIKIGEYYTDNFSKKEIEKGTALGWESYQVKKLPNTPIQAGDKVSSYFSTGINQKDMDNYIKLLENKVIDIDGILLEGQEEKFKKITPENYQKAYEGAQIEAVYVGQKPKASKKNFNNTKYKKINSSIDLVDQYTGEKFTVNKNVYELRTKENKKGFTIAAIKNYNNSPNSILTHEYMHAVQNTVGIPGEKEIFNKLSHSENSQNVNNGDYEYSNNFPDDYMGLTNGREVFTRATEGLFFPESNPYLYDKQAKNSEKIRNWALGAHAFLNGLGVAYKNNSFGTE